MKKLKQWLCLCLAGVSAMSVFAGNLLKNSDFSDLTGAKLPRYWTFQGKTLPEVTGKGCLTLGGNESGMMAIQYQLPVKPGTEYTMEWFAAGKAPYKSYIEYTTQENGRKKIKGVHYNLIKPVEQGSTVSFQFTVPDKTVQTYVVFSVKSTEKVTISKLSLLTSDEARRVAGILPNCDFSRLNNRQMPVGWKYPGQVKDYRFSMDKAEIKGKNLLIGNLSAAIGKSAVFSCRIAGQGKYRIYVEWYWTEDGKKCSGSTRPVWADAVPEGKKYTLPFSIPPHAKSAILAIRTDSQEFIEFSNLSVSKQDAEHFILSPRSTQLVPLPEMVPGKKYKVSYKVRGSGSTGNTTSFHFFRVELVARGDRIIAFPAEDCMEAFQNKSVTFAAPVGKKRELKIVSQSAGQLEFRDFAVVPVTDEIPAERLVVTSPRFRDSFYSSMPDEKRVAGYIVSARKLTGGEAVLTTASGKRLSAPLKPEGKRWSFELPGETGELAVSFAADHGSKSVMKRTIRRLAPAPIEVVTGPGRRLYINGKPFIPVEIGRLGPSLHEQASNGGTVVRLSVGHTPKRCLEILERGRKARIGVILSFMNTVPRTMNEDLLRKWEHQAENILTKEVLAHPSLVGYLIDDEPFWNGVPPAALARCYQVLCRLDPYHPVIICSAPRGTVEEQRPYAASCDIFGVDVYPIPVPNSHPHLDDKTISCVGKYVRRLEEITDGVKPVAIWLQGCSWQDYKKSDKLTGYPTREESRFMLFDAIINGADAIFYWGVWLIRKPDFYDDLMKLMRELHSLSGVLAAENDVPGKVGDPAIEHRRFHGEGWSCVIVANTRNQRVSATFTDIPGTPDGEQNFEPYEVKIFSTGKLPPPFSPLPETVPEKMRYRNQIIIRRDSTAYNAPENMKWIWGEKEKKIRGSRICARVNFTVGEGLKQAMLRFTADDFIIGISLDGRKVEPAEPLLGITGYLNVLDFTGALNPGKHVLMLEAGDSGRLPCGLLAELRLEYADGKAVSIPSNSAWETAPKASGPWQKAAEIKKIGERPWGMPKLLKPVKVK